MENIREVIDKMSPLDPISYMLAKKAQRNLRIHKTSVPIDHPESSILFAHLAKEVKEEFLRLALSTLMNRALLNAETKDFYIIVADVITADYPLGYYETIERKPARTPITITEQSGNDLTDYAIKIVLDDTWDGWDIVIDGSDIYFLDDQGNPLYYWIEEFDKQNKHAIIWVKIPSLSANSSITIYMHYGGNNPYAEYHDPSQVFLFFDDFDVFDTNKWNIIKGTPYIVNGFLYLPPNTIIETLDKLPLTGKNVELVARIKYLRSADGTLNSRFSFALRDMSRSQTNFNYATTLFLNGYGNDLRWNTYVGSWGSEVSLTPSSPNTWYKLKHLKNGAQFYGYAYNDDYSLLGSAGPRTVADIDYYLFFDTLSNQEIYVDWIRVRQYVDPEPSVSIGASELVEIETTNLDFPDGIDKILVTIDSDAHEAYFSIDGGQTWNPLTLDEEILLPETAYQLKLKFSSMTYFRGYALIGW